MLARSVAFFDPSSARQTATRRAPLPWTQEETAMTMLSTFLTWLIATAIAFAAAQEPPAKPQRFDYLVRADFFAAIAGDDARLQKVIDVCERTLAENPRHPEATVWHGAAVIARAAQAFQKGDAATGQQLFARGVKEMTDGVALAPDNPGVLIPRGAVLFEATRGLPPEAARPLVQSAVANYERALEVQTPIFATLGDHAKGELLFGLAEGYSRLGDTEKARRYFERLIADAPTSGQIAKARVWIETGAIPKTSGAQCVGCHK
jgi:tetratricopeptide (TPR) repeat protein